MPGTPSSRNETIIGNRTRPSGNYDPVYASPSNNVNSFLFSNPAGVPQSTRNVNTDTGVTYGSSGGYYMPGLDETTSRVWDPFQIFNKQPTEYLQFAGSSKLSGDQNALLTNLAGYLNNQAGQDQSYQGQLTAGLNPIQMSSIADLLNYKSPTAGLQGAQQQTLMDLISGKSGTREAMTNQYMTNIENPLMSRFQNVAMPALNASFASRGLSFGTDKQTATQASVATLMDSLAKGRADLESNITRSTMEGQIAGLGRANETQAQSLSEILGLNTARSDAGRTVQDTEQAGLSAAYNNWLRNQPGSNPAMQEIMKLLGIDTQYDQQVVVPNQEGGGGIMGMIGSIFG